MIVSLFGARRSAILAVALASAVASASTALAQTSRLPPLPEDTFTGAYLSGRTAIIERDLDAAAQFFTRSLRADPTNVEILAQAFRLRVGNGDVEQAMPLATRLLSQDKANELAKFALAAKAIKERAFGTARSNLANTDRTPLGKITGTLLLAWAMQGQGDTDGALNLLGGLTGPNWYDIFKNYHRALIADAAGRKADAAKWMKEAYDIDHSGLRIIEGYARTLARTGNAAGAQKALLDFSEQNPTHPVVVALLKDINLGKTPGPLVSNAQEGAAEVLYSLALVLSGDSDSNVGEELATIYLQLAVYLNHNADLARLALGSFFQDAQNYNKAMAVLRSIPEESVLKPTATIGVALNLDALKRTDEAAAQLRKLLDKTPGDLEVATALGDIYRAHKRFDEAASAYSEGVGSIKQPVRRNWRVFYFRGIAYERTKRWPMAEADFKKSLELFPDQPQVLNYLGYSWVDMGLNLDEALEMIRKAVKLRPDDGYIIDSLGWAYYKLARYDEAVSELERAVQLRPEDPTINDHLGDAYWQTGRKLEATFQWRHAKELSPEPEDLVKIVQKLESGLPLNATNKG